MTPKPTLRPGDHVYRYVWAGGERQDLQPLTVIRINRKSVTVEHADTGQRIYVHADDLHPMPADW